MMNACMMHVVMHDGWSVGTICTRVTYILLLYLHMVRRMDIKNMLGKDFGVSQY